MNENKKQEQKLRRQLNKAGYRLCKRGDGYMIVDVSINGIVAGSNAGVGYELSLDDVADWCSDL